MAHKHGLNVLNVLYDDDDDDDDGGGGPNSVDLQYFFHVAQCTLKYQRMLATVVIYLFKPNLINSVRIHLSEQFSRLL